MTRTALVIDDHPVTHLGCRRLLTGLGYDTVLEASDAAEAYRTLDRSAPDLIVLDIGLPGVGGLQMIRPLLDRVEGVRILVFSMNTSPAFAARALEEGAHGYLAKNSPPESFLTAVRRIEAGQVYLAANLAIDVATHTVRRTANPLNALTGREHQVLRLIGQGMDYTGIAAELNVSYKTVANACTAIKRKLSARTLSDLIRIAVQNDLETSHLAEEPGARR